MGRAGDAPAARSLVVPRMRNDRISPQPGQAKSLLSLRLWVSLRPMTRAHVTLLGPCFKTGRVDSLPPHHRLLAPLAASRTQPSAGHNRAIIWPAVTGYKTTRTRMRQPNRHARMHTHEPPSQTYCTKPMRSADYTRKQNACSEPQACQRATCHPNQAKPQGQCKIGLTATARQRCPSW